MAMDFKGSFQGKMSGSVVKLVVTGAVAESADAVDLKSTGRDTLRVQVPPAPQKISDLRLIIHEKDQEMAGSRDNLKSQT